MIRRFFNLITLLFLLSFVVGVRAQQQLTVSDGTVKKPQAPVDIVSGNYATKSQFVIPGSDLYSMYNGYIDSLSFYPNEVSNGAIPYTSDKDVSIYIKEVSYTQISGLENLTDDDLVFKGKIHVDKDEKGVAYLRFKLIKPYHYKGGNLLIGSEATEKISSKSINFFGSKVSKACYAYVKGITEGQYDFIPKTTFTYYAAPTITDIVTTPTTATVSWTGDAEKYKLRYAPVYFFDDFENGIDRWTVKREGEGNEYTDWRIYSVSSNDNDKSHSGVGALLSRSYVNKQAYHIDNWIISPKVKLAGTLKYWVRDDGKFHEHYDVYVSTTDDEISSFVLLASPGNATSKWIEVSIDLSSLAGQEGYIAFRNADYDQDYLEIDDVGIFPTDGSWTEIADATSPYTIENLTSDSPYAVQIGGIIMDGLIGPCSTQGFIIQGNPVPTVVDAKATAYKASVSWAGYGESYDVQYRAASYNVVYFNEDFDNNLNAWTLVDCHQNTGLNGNGAACRSGKGGFAFRFTTTPPQYLISKELSDIPDGSNLLFYYKNYSTAYTESFAVGYSSTTNDVDAFTFGDVINIQNNQWTAFHEAIPAGTKYICIKCTSDDKHYLFIDDLYIYKNIAAGEWITIPDINDRSVAITGLAPQTKYDLQVRSKKGDKVSKWTDIVEFTTAEEQVLSNLFTDANVWTTYVPSTDTALPEGLTAYTVSSLGNTSANAEPVDYLPKSVPVLLKRVDTSVNTYVADIHIGTEFNDNNLLVAADDVHQPQAHLDYVLYNDEFVLVSGGTLADGLVYLSVPKNYTSRAFTRSIVIGGSEDDGTTGIDSTPTLSEGEDAWFDLSGRKITAPTRKGIYIKNGKKVVVL